MTLIGKKLEVAADQKYIMEEFLANQADLEQAGFFKSLVQKIKMALRKCGFKAKWTDNEIKTLLRRSLAKQQRERKTGKSGRIGNFDGVRYAVEGSQGKAVRFLEENGEIIPIAEGFDFDKTANMQQAMQDYISLLDGEHFTIKEDNTDVYFDKNSATEYARSNDTSRLRNHKSKLFKAKAKAVSAVGSIVENAAGGRDEAVKAGHSKEGKKGKYRRYDVEFGLPSGINEVKVYTGELVVWNPEKGNSTFYDITNINFSRKVRDIANTIDTTGSRLKDGTNPHQLPANGDTLSQLPENASENQKKLRFSLKNGENAPQGNEGTDKGVRFSIAEKDIDFNSPISPITMPKVPDGINLKSIPEVRDYLIEVFSGSKFEIQSDGRPVAIEDRGVQSAVKKRGKSRQALFDLKNIVETSFFAGYEYADKRHLRKSKDINGQFVYGNLLNINNTPYIVIIKLDDFANDNYVKFKDIAVKEMASAVRGSNDKNNLANPPAQMPKYTIQQVIDFVKSNFEKNPLFSENIADSFDNRVDEAYLSAINRGDMEKIVDMLL